MLTDGKGMFDVLIGQADCLEKGLEFQTEVLLQLLDQEHHFSSFSIANYLMPRHHIVAYLGVLLEKCLIGQEG